MPRKPILIDPKREFCGKPFGFCVPKIKNLNTEPENRNSAAVPLAEPIRVPKLEVFIPTTPGATMETALARATAEKKIIASNNGLSRVLIESDAWKTVRETLPCWTRTLTAYDKPDQKLGKIIEYIDEKTGIRYIFPVPEEHQGKKNIILVAEHPDFTLETDRKNRIIQAKVVDVVEDFPASNGWHLGDPKYDLPFGEKIDGRNKDARYLSRMEKRVGVVARAHVIDFDYLRRYVLLDGRPSIGLGVAVEASENIKAQITNE